VDQDGEVVDVYLQAKRGGAAVTTRLRSDSSSDCFSVILQIVTVFFIDFLINLLSQRDNSLVCALN
jgi:hypothetical protein